jgi:tRNA(Leu) C34 or U34 (ribose-2'-O)-methylase TrmL
MFGIGIYHPKKEENVGTLFRSAYCLGADFIFTIGRRYKRQASDTCNTPAHIPLYEFETYDRFNRWYDCYREEIPASLIGIECPEDTFKYTACSLYDFNHPKDAIYLLGSEDHGLPERVLYDMDNVVYTPMSRGKCLNVSATGSIVMYDRIAKIRNPSLEHI